eukprot:Rmarinus@m.20565
MRVLWGWFLLLFGLLGAFLVHAHEPAVVELTPENIDTELESGEWFILFYAPWCENCQRFEPIWDEISTALQGYMNVGKIDGAEHASLVKKYGVDGYPRLMVFRDGHPHLYRGMTHYRDIMVFLDNLVRDAVHPLRGRSETRNFLRDHPVSFVLLGAADHFVWPTFRYVARYFQAEESGVYGACTGTTAEREGCLAVCLEFAGHALGRRVRAVSSVASAEDVDEFTVTLEAGMDAGSGGLPDLPDNAIAVFKDGTAGFFPENPHAPASRWAKKKISVTEELLFDWVDKQRRELVSLAKPENYFDLTHEGKMTVIVLLPARGAEQDRYIEGMRLVAKEYPQVNYLYHDGVTDTDLWNGYAEDEFDVRVEDLPVLLLYDGDYRVYYKGTLDPTDLDLLPVESVHVDEEPEDEDETDDDSAGFVDAAQATSGFDRTSSAAPRHAEEPGFSGLATERVVEAAILKLLRDVVNGRSEARGIGATSFAWYFNSVWSVVGSLLPAGVWDQYWPMLLIFGISALQYLIPALVSLFAGPRDDDDDMEYVRLKDIPDDQVDEALLQEAEAFLASQRALRRGRAKKGPEGDSAGPATEEKIASDELVEEYANFVKKHRGKASGDKEAGTSGAQNLRKRKWG